MSAAQQNDRTGLVTAIDKSGGIYRFAKLLGVPHTVVCGWLVDEQQGGGELPQDERAAFGEWWAKFESAHPDWRYADAYAMRWNVWQARAALAQRAASVPAQAGQPVIPVGWCLVQTSRYVTDAILESVNSGFETKEYERILAASEGLYEEMKAQGRITFPDQATPVTAASVQPDIGRDAADAARYRWLRAVGPAQQNVIAHYALEEMDKEVDKAMATHAAPSDAGRDAALVNQIELLHGAYITRETKTTGANGWLLRNEHGLVRALNVFETEFVDCALAAQASQAAPEVASVPDAGDEPVAIRWPDGRGRYNFADVSDTVTQDALSKSEDLYTRPQPAPAVLSDEQIDAACADVWHSDHQDDSKSYERAVLAAAEKGGAA